MSVMKIRLTTPRGGFGFSQVAGQELEVEPETAKRMIAAGQAVPVVERQRRTATKKPTAKETRTDDVNLADKP